MREKKKEIGLFFFFLDFRFARSDLEKKLDR